MLGVIAITVGVAAIFIIVFLVRLGYHKSKITHRIF